LLKLTRTTVTTLVKLKRRTKRDSWGVFQLAGWKFAERVETNSKRCEWGEMEMRRMEMEVEWRWW
jgi:hypothetical protein